MERLTIDTKFIFCDISQCRELPGGSFCEDGYCDQRRVYERLREYERLGDIDYLTALAAARKEGRVVVLPCKLGDSIFVRGRDGYLYEMTAENVAIVDSDGDANLLDWFGKTVFLTRAEADAALKGAVENAD